jgi:hypothetical protein
VQTLASYEAPPKETKSAAAPRHRVMRVKSRHRVSLR